MTSVMTLVNGTSAPCWGRHFFQFVGLELSKVASASTALGHKLLVVSSFVWREGWLLHNVLSLVFQSLTGYTTASFMTFILRVCLRASLTVLSLPRSRCHFRLHSLMQLTNALAVPL
jgi:hypothetical protein